MIIKVIKKALKIVTAPQRKVLGWLFKMPDMPDAAAVMVEKQGSDHPIPVVYGRRKIGVIKVHKYVTDLPGGAQNELLHLICVLCEGPVDAIEQVFFDGVSEGDPRWLKDKNRPSINNQWFTIERYQGLPNQPASSSAVSGIPNWTTDHTLNGLAYLYIVLQMDKDQTVWRGEPEITAIVRGRAVFDPRTNSVAYSENPALQLLDYLKNPIYGKGLPAHRLDLNSFVAAANFADENLSSTVIVNGNPSLFNHNRFSGNQVVDTGRSLFSNVQQMLSAMRGSLPIGSGVLRLQLERDTSPVFYFSHGRSDQLNHATITGRIKSSGGSKKDRFNRVVVRFPNAALDFERDEVFYPDSEDPQFTQWLAEDNGVLLEQNFEFNTITNKAEAIQMARIIALRSRFQLQCSFTASPAAIVVEPGDVVGITDDTRGWDAKPFRVEQVKLKDDGDVELEFIEHQNAIYPWSGTTYEERTGGTNLGDPTNIPAPTGLFITPDPTFATGGLLSWSIESNAFVRRFLVAIFKIEEQEAPEEQPETPPAEELEPELIEVFRSETPARSISIPVFEPGNYSATVWAVSTLGTTSLPAVLSYTLISPEAPTDIEFTVGNFEIEARPVLENIGLGTVFEFAIGDTSVVRGRGVSIVFTGLRHNTEYPVFARTVNALGVSPWFMKFVTTTADASNIIDLIGEDVGDTIFDDVVDEIRGSLDSILDRVELIDARELIVEGVNDAFEDLDLTKAIVKETNERRDQNRVIVGELTQLTASVDEESANRQSQFAQLTTAISDETSSRVTQVTLLDAKINTETSIRQAQNSTISQAIVDESSVRASQVNQLQAVIQTESALREAQVINLTEAIVNESTSRATQVAQLDASITTESGRISATVSRVDQAEVSINGNAQAISGLRTAVAGSDSQSQAELILSSTVDKAGQAFSRAFLGVTTVVGGRAVINGIVIDGETNTLEFRADTLRLSDTSGNVKLYWETGLNTWVFSGDIIGSGITGGFLRTATPASLGLRVAINENPNWPLWIGTGPTEISGSPSDNYVFRVASSGLIELFGRLATSAGSGVRVDVGDDGTYLIWAGTGAKTDLNGIFWIKTNGQGFIKGDFFQGQIIESKLSTVQGSFLPVTASVSHLSNGKNVKVTGSGTFRLTMAGNTSGTVQRFRINLIRGGSTIRTVEGAAQGVFDSELNRTDYFGSLAAIQVDTLATAGSRTYQAQFQSVSGPSGTIVTSDAAITLETFENKLES